MRVSFVQTGVMLLVLALPGTAADLPPLVREAVFLELEGRLGEALDRYRAALLSETPTVFLLSKAAHLSIDLGYGEEAWDLSTQLLAEKGQKAAEAGTLVRMRLYRIQGKWTEALTLFDRYAAQWPLPAPGPTLLSEALRVRLGAKKSGAPVDSLIQKLGGPSGWVLKGNWSFLSGPTETLGLTVQESVRLQVGAFKDWNNALTLIDMLREKGWSPFTEARTNSQGEKLHIVYLVSRQAASDRARLEAQGLTPIP